MKFVKNPASGEVKHVTPLEAKRLKRYSWVDSTHEEFQEYRSATIRAAMVRNMPSTRNKLGRLH